MEGVSVTFELEGWSLLFADLERVGGDGENLAALLDRTASEAHQRHAGGTLTDDPAVAALRRLFRAAGCDPTRYRPSSEALLRRVLKGSEPPPISPLVDLNNCLSLELAVPCCVMAEEAVEPPFVLRAGRAGETYESLKGPFNLEGKPLLVDRLGPCDAPITGSDRVRIRSTTRRALLVAYLPRGVVQAADALTKLRELVAQQTAIRLSGSCSRPSDAEQTHQ